MGWRAALIALIAVLAPAPTAFAANFTVTGTGEGGSCTGTTCTSLRAAIAAAEATKTEADTISVPDGVIQINNDLVVQSEMTIIGADARKTIIDGGAKYRLRATAPAVLSLNRFTIRNGAAGGGDITDGGGIYNAGRLSLQDVRVTQSTAARGGGIANNLGVVVADNLLVDNNVATGSGGAGGIVNVAGQEFADIKGWLILTDSTIFKNTATGTGSVGGVVSTGTGASVSLSRSTLADNVGGARGIGGLVASGNTQVVGSIVARNLVAGDIVNCDADRRPTDGHFNVEDDKDCGLAPGAMKPGLATALTNDGGQVPVLAITTGGDAFNRMPFGDTPCEGTDARGLSRPQGSACDAGAYEIDQAATVAITEGPSGTITSTSTQFNFQANESGVTVQCDLAGPGQTAGWEECYKSNAQPYSNLVDGPYTFSVRAVSASFPNPPVTTRSFVVNATGAPNTTITGGPSGPTNTATPAFTFTSTEQGSTFQCRVDTAAFAACTTPHTTATLSQGAHTFDVRAIDAAGTVDASPASRAFTVDTAAPETTLGTGGPSGTVASTSATFTYTSEANATFQCALDGSAFGPCPVSYTGLAQGSHTFEVRAVDIALNVDPTPAARTWTVDTVAPAAPVITAPVENALLATGTVNMTGTAEAGATVQLTEGATSAGSSPVSATGTWNVVLTPADGTHTYSARTRDAAGNVSPTTTRTIRIDTQLPDTTIATGPDGPTNDTTPTWTFTSTEAGSTFECSLDGVAHTACASPFTPTLAAGAHTLSVRAVDAAGNRDNTPATRSVTVDVTAPTVTITGGPNASTNDTTPTFTFTSEAGVGFECRIDAAAFAACTSGFTPTVTAQTGHTFEVRATDAAGNVSATASRAFTIDTTAPTVTITGGPPSPGNDTTPTFTFTSEASAGFQCRVDSVAFASCTSPHTTVTLAAGPHTFDVRATDAAGNVSTVAQQAFTIDTSAATATITTGPSGPTNDNTPTFEFTSEAGATFQCRIDTAAYATCSSPFTRTAALADGLHTFDVRATDVTGNQGGAASRSFTVDTAAPTVSVTGGPNGPTNDTTPTFTFTSEAGAGFQCRIDAAAFASCDSGYTPTVTAQGAHTFQVRATDAAANTSTVQSRAFTTDTTAPTVTITGGPSGPTNDTTPTFSFASEAGATFQCRIDTAAFADCSSGFTPPALAQSGHTFEVRATDTAGNVSTEAARTFTVDTTPPTVTVTGGPTDPTNDTTPTFAFGSEAGATFQCRIDTGGFADCSSGFTPTVTGQGAHTFEVRATDAAGNAGTATRGFTTDTVAPTVNITGGPNGPTNDTTPTFTFTSEAGANLECRIDAATFAGCATGFTPTVTAQGAHTFAVRATDAAGNVGTPATRGFTIDTTAPAAPGIAGPNGPTNDTTPTFTFTGEAGATFRCRMDTGAFADCPAAYTPPALGQGGHTVEVLVRDAAGNDGPTTERSFSVDTTAPAAPAVVAPEAGEALGNASVTVIGTAETGATVEVREGSTLRGSEAATGGAFTIAVSAVADGPHTYAITARDAAGNTSAATTRSFTVDTGAPPKPALNGPSGPTNDSTPTFTFTGETTTFECTLDGMPFACGSPFTPELLADGPHSFMVTVFDAAGNASEPASLAFVVDTTQPAPPDVSGPAGPTTDVNPVFTFSASAPTTECRLDGPAGVGAFGACASPKAFNALTPGDYVFLVRTTDDAGNQSTTQRAFTVTQVQQATPTPTPAGTVTPAQTPTPVPNQTIVVTPKPGGTVLVKAKGEKAFSPLDVTKGIPNGSEVDVRKGRVTLTSIPKPGAAPESADFYGGMFIVTQKGGITDLKLSEPLTGCPKTGKASASAGKKSRKLWGNGKGSFRTSGKYSAATVRGTIWLVQDNCTSTLTRVTQGVVSVKDFVTKKSRLVKRGQRYTARAKR